MIHVCNQFADFSYFTTSVADFLKNILILSFNI